MLNSKWWLNITLIGASTAILWTFSLFGFWGTNFMPHLISCKKINENLQEELVFCKLSMTQKHFWKQQVERKHSNTLVCGFYGTYICKLYIPFYRGKHITWSHRSWIQELRFCFAVALVKSSRRIEERSSPTPEMQSNSTAVP